jgi:hypothetical protein
MGPVSQAEAGQRQISVFLLDHHEIVRRGVAELLEAEPDIAVVGDADFLRRRRGPACSPELPTPRIRAGHAQVSGSSRPVAF